MRNKSPRPSSIDSVTRRKQFGQAVVRMAGDAVQHVPQVGEGFNVMTLAGGNQAEEDRGGAAAFVRAGVVIHRSSCGCCTVGNRRAKRAHLGGMIGA